MASDRIALFSGRFDRPHLGHIVSILRVGQRFNKVIVVVLDYPEQEYSVYYRAQMLDEILSNSVGNYDVIVNKEHFGKITAEQLRKYEFDVYASGNHDCLKHIESLGKKVMYIDRAYDFAATDDRQIQRIKKALSV